MEATSRQFENEIYRRVAEELSRGEYDESIFLKAVDHSSGDKQLARSLYIRYRVRSILDDIEAKARHHEMLQTKARATLREQEELEIQRRIENAKLESQRQPNNPIPGWMVALAAASVIFIVIQLLRFYA